MTGDEVKQESATEAGVPVGALADAVAARVLARLEQRAPAPLGAVLQQAPEENDLEQVRRRAPGGAPSPSEGTGQAAVDTTTAGFRLDPELKTRLRGLAASRGITLSQLVEGWVRQCAAGVPASTVLKLERIETLRALESNLVRMREELEASGEQWPASAPKEKDLWSWLMGE